MNTIRIAKSIIICFVLISMLNSCSQKKGEEKEEQIRLDIENLVGNGETDSIANSIKGNVSLSQIATTPNAVILTGLSDHRLVTVYKSKEDNKQVSRSWYGTEYYEGDESEEEHFMPGIDILYGFNLLNIAHYDMKSEKLKFLFDRPALVKTLYYPSTIQDSTDKKPINRDYYLISVYDEDTNKDTLINRKDLRKFYYFDASCTIKTQLVPNDYSVIRSQYDDKNDVMYIFAKQDTNKNGTGDTKEPTHIFWIDLKAPAKAKKMY